MQNKFLNQIAGISELVEIRNRIETIGECTPGGLSSDDKKETLKKIDEIINQLLDKLNTDDV